MKKVYMYKAPGKPAKRGRLGKIPTGPGEERDEKLRNCPRPIHIAALTSAVRASKSGRGSPAVESQEMQKED